MTEEHMLVSRPDTWPYEDRLPLINRKTKHLGFIECADPLTVLIGSVASSDSPKESIHYSSIDAILKDWMVD